MYVNLNTILQLSVPFNSLYIYTKDKLYLIWIIAYQPALEYASFKDKENREDTPCIVLRLHANLIVEYQATNFKFIFLLILYTLHFTTPKYDFKPYKTQT